MGLKATLCLSLLVQLCLLRIDGVSGIMCYQCSDTGGNPDCLDYQSLLKSARTNGDLTRNCSDNYCMTEKYVKQGIIYSFIRDCTNNTIGSYSFPIKGRLHLLKPNNVTVCRFNVETLGHECLSLCESDFCNGPNSGAVGLLPPGPTGLYISLILILAVFVPNVRFVNLYL